MFVTRFWNLFMSNWNFRFYKKYKFFQIFTYFLSNFDIKLNFICSIPMHDKIQAKRNGQKERQNEVFQDIVKKKSHKMLSIKQFGKKNLEKSIEDAILFIEFINKVNSRSKILAKKSGILNTKETLASNHKFGHLKTAKGIVDDSEKNKSEIVFNDMAEKKCLKSNFINLLSFDCKKLKKISCDTQRKFNLSKSKQDNIIQNLCTQREEVWPADKKTEISFVNPKRKSYEEKPDQAFRHANDSHEFLKRSNNNLSSTIRPNSLYNSNFFDKLSKNKFLTKLKDDPKYLNLIFPRENLEVKNGDRCFGNYFQEKIYGLTQNTNLCNESFRDSKVISEHNLEEAILKTKHEDKSSAAKSKYKTENITKAVRRQSYKTLQKKP